MLMFKPSLSRGAYTYEFFFPFGELFANLLLGVFLFKCYDYVQERIEQRKNMEMFLSEGLDVGMQTMNTSLNLLIDGKFSVLTIHEEPTSVVMKSLFERKHLRSSIEALTGEDSMSDSMFEQAYDVMERKIGADLDADGIIGDPKSALPDDIRTSIEPFVPTFHPNVGKKMWRLLVNHLSCLVGRPTLQADLSGSVKVKKYVWGLTYESKEVATKDRKLRVLLIRESLLREIYRHKDDLDSIPLSDLYGPKTGWLRVRLKHLATMANLYYNKDLLKKHDRIRAVIGSVLLAVPGPKCADEEDADMKLVKAIDEG